MMENNHRINALRTVYKRRLLSTVITATDMVQKKNSMLPLKLPMDWWNFRLEVL